MSNNLYESSKYKLINITGVVQLTNLSMLRTWTDKQTSSVKPDILNISLTTTFATVELGIL